MFDELCQQVRSAAGRVEVRDAVHELYSRVQQRVEERQPVCTLSGRCCKFEEYGHRLYVTTIELAAFVRDLAAQAPRSHPLPLVTSTSGTCPFQIGKLCGVHRIRPFGCRMFYCDPTAQEWQSGQYELFHAELKRLHDRFDVRYFYVEWRAALVALGLDATPAHA